jgi:hypothetical protein
MSAWEQGEIRVEVIQDLRELASRDMDVPELVEHLRQRLAVPADRALFPTLAYFRAAFGLSLREAMPLREWLSGKDRTEVDSILIPAMQRTKEQWQPPELQGV